MESIGQVLKAARERRHMTVADVTAATKMTSTAVEAIEADRFGIFVAPFYARSFVKLYAECVGLDPQPLLKQVNVADRAARSQPPLPGRAEPVSPKVAPAKTSVTQAGASKPVPKAVGGRSPAGHVTGKMAVRRAGDRASLTPAVPGMIPDRPLSRLPSLLAGRWPALDWAVITRIRWPRFEKPDLTFLEMKLPAMVWRRIFMIGGVVLLVIVTALVWEWSNRGMPSLTDASRWLADPPAPYLTLESRAPAPGR